MKQTNTGRWAHKPGQLPSMLTNITNPSNADWSLYTLANGNMVVVVQNFYNSPTKYFAVKRDRN